MRNVSVGVWPVVLVVFSGLFAAQPSVMAQTDGDRGGVAPVGMTLEEMKTERRVALVIGNSAYANAALKNPGNDARLMAQQLRGLGFEVSEGFDLDQKAMKRAVVDFGRKLKGGGVGLFYYAGHGMQVGGRNYLIPIRAQIEAEVDVEIESVDVAFVMAQMEKASNRLNIVVLDACRNNPFARAWRSQEGGLASVNAPSGTLIAYATAPGSVASDGEGQNGVFTKALAQHIQRPGARIEEVFKATRTDVKRATEEKQTPWESSSLEGDFYFILPDALSAQARPVLREPVELVVPERAGVDALPEEVARAVAASGMSFEDWKIYHRFAATGMSRQDFDTFRVSGLSYDLWARQQNEKDESAVLEITKWFFAGSSVINSGFSLFFLQDENADAPALGFGLGAIFSVVGTAILFSIDGADIGAPPSELPPSPYPGLDH